MLDKNTKLGVENQKNRTIVLNIPKTEYNKFMTNNTFCKTILEGAMKIYPELFPDDATTDNYNLNGSSRVSIKSGFRLKKIIINGTHYEIRPSWLLSYQRGETKDVKWAIFLLRFGVPFWVLALIFGKYAKSF